MNWSTAGVLGAAIALGLAGSAATARAPAPNLCRPGEVVRFTCKAGAKVISFCGEAAGLRYRFGRPGKPELTYPAPGQAANFHYSSAAYSGGGEARVRFTNGAYEYIVYTALIAGDWNPDGTRDHDELDGVLVRKGGRNLANVRCTTSPENDLYVLGDDLPREDFNVDLER
ncbi:MAG: hypothetical protein K1X35_10905 [Caulobacteraceae bacterium]|nr:hypothetical protein [Caulobacteraceae bacterium]